MWREIAINWGDVLFDISRSDFHGYTDESDWYHSNWDNYNFTFWAEYYAAFLPLSSEIRKSGTLDEVGVLDGVRTLVIPAPGGGTYSLAEVSAIKNFVLNGGRLIFTADRTLIAGAAIAEINNILQGLGSTLKFETDNAQTIPNYATLGPSSITTRTGPLCVTTGSEITMNLTHGDEAIAKFDNGKPVVACGVL